MDVEAVQIASDSLSGLGCKVFQSHNNGNRDIDADGQLVGEVGIFCLEGGEDRKCAGYANGECMKVCPLHIPLDQLMEIIAKAQG